VSEMAVIKKEDLRKMSKKEAEKKLLELEMALLELEGEGKREMRSPLKRAIAQLKTLINMKTESETDGKDLKAPLS